MCVISQTLCPNCGRQPWGYIFRPCEQLVSQIPVQRGSTLPSCRMSCPDFIWPPPDPIPVKVQHCEDCVYRGVPPKLVRNNNKDDAGNKADALFTAIVARASEPRNTLDLNMTDDSRQHRHLTLRIPYCNLCRKPYFCLRDTDDEVLLPAESQKPTIDGIEFEFSSVLWEWIQNARVWKMDGYDGVETNILSGFIHRPCNTCINRETTLRGKMILYVQQCDASEAWAVWMWLMMRGSGQVNFWWHELRNTGLPASPAPNSMEFRAVMAASWKARTGIAWEDMYDVELGEHPLLFTPHSELFTSLSQWNAFARIYHQPDPVPTLPPPLMDGNDITLEYEPVVERVHRCRTAQHGRHPGRATSCVASNNNNDNNNGNPALPVRTTPQPAQLTSALRKPGVKIKLPSGDEQPNGRPAKRLRFAEEAEELSESNRLPPHSGAQPEPPSPADSGPTLVDSDDSNEDLFDDTVAVLVPCYFGFYHVRNMDPNCAWQLPLGVAVEEGRPIYPPGRESPDAAETQGIAEAQGVVEAQDVVEIQGKGKSPEVVETDVEGKGKEPEVAETGVEGKGKEPEVVEPKDKGTGKEPAVVVIESNEQDTNQRQRVGTGLSKGDPMELSSDESTIYSDLSD
ncbi:hypothetical protein Hte_011989 [Hypoxylon texense]